MPQLPTGQQLQQLQGRGSNQGALAQQLRNRLMQSGLTPDQIRSRLEEAGYPDSLLDNYMGATPESVADTLTPSSEVLNAVAQLGIMDSVSVDSLIGTARLDSILAKRQKGVLADTVDTSFTSLADSTLLKRALQRLRKPPDAYAFDTTADSTEAADSARAVRAKIRSLLADTSLNYRRKERLLQFLAPEDTAMKVFGMSLFKRGSSQFQPVTAGAVDASYRIQPGDRLVLIVTGEVEAARTLIVTREGFTVIPSVGEIDVANLTLNQLEDLLYDRLSKVYSGVRRGPKATTHFSISIARLHTNQVFVIGDVAEPGSYQVSGAGTALTALYAAGGPDKNGSARRIYVRRGGKSVDSLDLYDYLLRGDASHDARLQTGDIVFVPVHGPRVTLTGEVVRPAIYEMAPGETLADLLRDAGGFQATAGRGTVQITRVVPPDQRTAHGERTREVINVSAPDLDSTGSAARSIALVADDSVHVYRVDVGLRNGITISGDVWTPGQVGFTPGMHLSDALRLAGGLRPDAYLGEVLVARLRPDSTRYQLRTSISDSTAMPVNDILLGEHDDIRIFALHEMRTRRYVAIAGAVRNGGRFAYHDGMTVRDLVLLAGGPTEGADLTVAEIARLPENRAGGVTAVTQRVPIDSSYSLERRPMIISDTNRIPAVTASAVDPPKEIVLQPYDNVLIFREADWSLPRTVVLTGEVRYPGRYTLISKTERIGALIKRAGGLTNHADPDGISLVRRQGKVGRIGVDIAQALSNPKARDNVILEDRDSVAIPPYTGIVRVQGEVNAPVSVSYVPGKDLRYYVNEAGGPSVHADMDHAYVSQPNGRVDAIRHQVLLPSIVPSPRPGATVFVPMKEIRLEKPDQTLSYVGLAVQMVAGLATVIYLTRH